MDRDPGPAQRVGHRPERVLAGDDGSETPAVETPDEGFDLALGPADRKSGKEEQHRHRRGHVTSDRPRRRFEEQIAHGDSCKSLTIQQFAALVSPG